MSQNGNGVVVYQERLPNRISWEEWTIRVRNIGTLKRKIAWYIGDLLNYGLDAFGEKAWQEIESMGYSEGALSNFKYVAKKFPPEERSSDLPWSTYQAIAPFRKAEREKLIVRALSGELKRADIRALSAETNGNGHDAVADDVPNRLIDALLLVGKLLSRESKGESVQELLEPALDSLISESMAKLASLHGKS